MVCQVWGPAPAVLPAQMWRFSEPGSPRTPHSCPGKVTAKGNPGGKPAEASLAPSVQRTPPEEKRASGDASGYLEARQVRAGARGPPVPVARGALLRGGVSQLHPGPRVPQEPREAGPLREKRGVSLERGGARGWGAGGRGRRSWVTQSGAVPEGKAHPPDISYHQCPNSQGFRTAGLLGASPVWAGHLCHHPVL